MWSHMDGDIETVVKQHTDCQQSRPSSLAAPLHPWEWPAHPWSRLHLDFAGPFLGHMFLVLVDAHSKWMEVKPMNSISATKTIKLIFATHGLPRKIVTDNGPTFISQEFQDFMHSNGISHITSAPYHPSTNGLAERAVQSFKQGIKRIPGASIQDRLSHFLFHYRITPHSTTGLPPAEMLMGRRLRSRLDLLFPDVSQWVETQQQRQKHSHDSTKPKRTFSIGNLVYAENFSVPSTVKWLSGKVVQVTGPLSYSIELLSGGTVQRHVDQLLRRETPPTPSDSTPSSLVTQVDPLILPDLSSDKATFSQSSPPIPPNPILLSHDQPCPSLAPTRHSTSFYANPETTRLV